jgi:hypothetical protein
MLRSPEVADERRRQMLNNDESKGEEALDDEQLEHVSGGSTGAYVITSVTHSADSSKQTTTTQTQYAESDLDFIER